MRIWSLFGKAEKVALEFFKRKESDSCSKTANQIKKLFSSHDRYLDYILLEGSLKADLLKSGIFSKEETAFLQEGPAGGKALCQIVEFVMNALKLGHTVWGLSADQYIVPIDPDKPFTPLSNSVVFFPKRYGDLYGLDSPSIQCFKKCFSVIGEKKADITIWDVTYPYQGSEICS